MDETIRSSASKPSYICIYCGKTWGGGINNNTHGICIECFAKWALTKYNCFGNFKDGCNDCKINKYCKEYYEFKISM